MVHNLISISPFLVDYMPRATSVTKFYPEVGRNDVAVGSSNFVVPDKGYSQLSSSGIDLTKTSPWASDSKYDGFSFDARSSSSYSQMSPPTTGATGRRSPSFLDSINISKVSAASLPSIGSFATDTYDLVHPKDSLGSSNSENLTKPSKITGNGVDPYKHAVEKDVGNMDSRHSFYSQKQNEDFAALEQVIIQFSLFYIVGLQLLNTIYLQKLKLLLTSWLLGWHIFLLPTLVRTLGRKQMLSSHQQCDASHKADCIFSYQNFLSTMNWFK